MGIIFAAIFVGLIFSVGSVMFDEATRVRDKEEKREENFLEKDLKNINIAFWGSFIVGTIIIILINLFF